MGDTKHGPRIFEARHINARQRQPLHDIGLHVDVPQLSIGQ